MDGFPFLASFSVANSEEREGGGSRARAMKDKEKEGRWGVLAYSTHYIYNNSQQN